MKSRLSLAEFPAASHFLQAYADLRQWENGALSQWFPYNPHDPSCFAKRIEELRGREIKPSLPALAAAPNTFSVVTGQQVGLFGGPIFSQLKAIAAIRLARQLAQQFPDCNFVPVFWLASNDSDFEEVRRTHLLNRAGEVREIELPPNGTHWEGELIADRDVAEHLSHALGQLTEDLPGGEYRDEVLASVQVSYASGNLASGFADWMAKLFDGTGLVLCDPRSTTMANGIAALAEVEIRQAAEIGPVLDGRDAELEAAGFQIQVARHGGDTNLFFLNEGRREKITRQDGKFVLRPSGRTFTADELLALVRAEPNLFVNSALLTPLYQDTLLRPVAFIGGGAELAYRAQSSALANLHGIKLAPSFLRATATLLPRKSAEVLDELGWELPDLYRPLDDVIKAAVALDKPEDIARALEEYFATIQSADAKLREVAIGFDPTLEETFETLRGNLIRHLEKLDKKITGSLKQRGENRVRRVTTLHNQVYPRGVVQERELSLLSFLPRYGFGLIDELIDKLEFPSWEHQVVVL